MLSAGPSIPHGLAHLIFMAHGGQVYYYAYYMQPAGLGCVGEKAVEQVCEQA